MKGVRIIFLILLIASNKFLFGQSQDTLSYPYKITGTIRDISGNPMPGVNIVSPGDGNRQVSDIDGKYYAYIYGPKMSVIFSCYKFSSVKYCPDGRTKVDIVLSPEKVTWVKRLKWRIGYPLRSKKKKRESYSCS
jgi:hypothetical protein